MTMNYLRKKLKEPKQIVGPAAVRCWLLSTCSLVTVCIIFFTCNFVIVQSVTFESAQELFKIGFACDFAKAATQNCISTLRRSFQVSPNFTHHEVLIDQIIETNGTWVTQWHLVGPWKES